jgi:recombinational DNA repair protein RecR
VDRETTSCRSCGAETQSIDICPACADAMREERAAEQARQCRVHRVRHVEDLPVSVLAEMQAERGRC